MNCNPPNRDPWPLAMTNVVIQFGLKLPGTLCALPFRVQIDSLKLRQGIDLGSGQKTHKDRYLTKIKELTRHGRQPIIKSQAYTHTQWVREVRSLW